MVTRINPQIEYMWNSSLDIAAFAGVGYLSGKAVNWFTKWSSVPSIFHKTPQVDLTSAAVCCAVFAAIDRLAHAILGACLGAERANRPIYSAIRIGAGMVAAMSAFEALASQATLPRVETQAAVAVILTAIVIYSQIISHLMIFNSRYAGSVMRDDDDLFIHT
jgi:hypothetical protein